MVAVINTKHLVKFIFDSNHEIGYSLSVNLEAVISVANFARRSTRAYAPKYADGACAHVKLCPTKGTTLITASRRTNIL